MATDAVFAGQMTSRVEVFKYTSVNNTSGESVKTAVSLGKKWVKRVDVSGSEEEDGRLIALNVAKFMMRYTAEMMLDGTKYIIRDFDGDFEVNSVAQFGPRRKSFLEIKCSKRGE
jgi:head-tail adaptor